MIINLVRKIVIIMLSINLLSGCATMRAKPITTDQLLQQMKQQLIKEGKSENFADGYIDGCSSGKSIITDSGYQAKKDQIRTSLNKEYSLAWERGYYACRDEIIAKIQAEEREEYVPAKDMAEEMERAKIWEDVRK